MAQNFRHSEILTLARETGKVTVEELATRFNVTAQTIRRDLGELCDVGQLTRVHGGAMIPSGVIALGYEDRRSLASQEKDAIARLRMLANKKDASVDASSPRSKRRAADAFRSRSRSRRQRRRTGSSRSCS